jgi:hypothetical protein
MVSPQRCDWYYSKSWSSARSVYPSLWSFGTDIMWLPNRWISSGTRWAMYHCMHAPLFCSGRWYPQQVFSAPNYVDQAGNKGAFVSNVIHVNIVFCLNIFVPPTSRLGPHRCCRHAGVFSVRCHTTSSDETYGVCSGGTWKSVNVNCWRRRYVYTVA